MRTILDTAHDAFITIDAKGVILDWNRQAEATFGWSREEAIGRLLAETIIPPQYREAHARGLARFPTAGREQVFDNRRLELTALHKSGRELSVELTVWPTRVGDTWHFNAFVRDISQQKQAEEMVRQERTFSDALIKSLPGVVYLYDESGRFLKWNKNFERVTGYTGDEIARMHPLDFFAGPDKELVAARIGEVFQKGVSDVEADFVAKDGTRTPYYFTGVATQIKGTHCVIGMGIDIAERKRAETALKEREELFQAFMDNCPALAWMKNAAGQYSYTNKAHRTFFKQSTVGKHDTDFMPAVAARELRANDQKVLATRQTLETVETVPDAEGRVHYFLIVKFPVRDSSGERFVGGFAFDITERKQAEVSLSRLAGIVESSDDAITAVDLNGVFTSWNAGAERLFGYTAAEAIGHTNHMLLTPDRENEEAEILPRVARGERIENYETVRRRKDGTLVDVSVTASPVRDASGKIIGISKIGRDITERKQLQESSLAKLSAERANQAKSEFLSRMSHELRTPLNAVLGFAQMLEMETLTAKQQQRVQHILKGGRHLLALINEVLDITRIEAGRMTLSIEPVLATTVIGEAVDLVRPQAASRHIQLVTPSAEGKPVYVLAEQQRLKQVVLNLLSNGVKYNREGGTLTVSCEATSERQYRITVTDTGGGIPPALLSRLFTPFDRLGADSRIEGTGLGLVLSRNLMMAMGGTLSVESEVGRGTSFALDLPLTGPPAGRAESVPSRKVEISAPLSGKAVTVLYIEDNQANYRLVEELVEKRPGIKLIGAMQGQLGVELAIAHRPDLILLDLNLPDIQGDEVLLRLRERPETATIPVVMLSADAMQKQVDKLLAAGAQRYMTKPIDVTQFYSLLDDLMTNKGGH